MSSLAPQRNLWTLRLYYFQLIGGESAGVRPGEGHGEIERDHDADYVLALQDNQGQLCEDVQWLFSDLEGSQYRCRVRKDHGPENLAVLRHLASNYPLKFGGVDAPVTFNAKSQRKHR
jgi:hypothetical protein